MAYLPGAVGGRGASGAVTRALGQLQSDARVRYAEPNYIFHADATPNDPLFNRLWGLDNSGQLVNGAAGTPDADIDAPEAWSVTTGSDNVTVAVIDTGIDSAHPDLSPQMWTNPGENCAGCRTAIRFPFPVRAFGEAYDSAVVSSDGVVQFDGDVWGYTNACPLPIPPTTTATGHTLQGRSAQPATTGSASPASTGTCG